MEETTGQKIKALRHKKHISQGTLANGLGISTAAISKIEGGRTDISINRLLQIAKYFQVSPASLLPGRNDDKKLLRKLDEANEKQNKQLITITGLQNKVISLYEEIEVLKRQLGLYTRNTPNSHTPS